MKFADTARKCEYVSEKKRYNAQDDKLIKQLRREVNHLKDILNMRRTGHDKESMMA